jgi:hypothetical protein
MEAFRSGSLAGIAFAALLLAPGPGVARGGDAPADAVAGADIDVSDVKPQDCRNCHNSGAVPCLACNGSGRSYKAQVECAKCKGKGTVECVKCKDGMMRCPDCSKRTVDGLEISAVLNPEWKKWNDQYGLQVRRYFTAEAVPKDIPPAPKKYIPCAKCEGKGMMKCTDCNGTKTAPCKACNGAGKVTGAGPCPTCNGTKQAVCPQCAVLEGGEGDPAFAALEDMRGKKVLSDAEYYQQRRLLVAREKRRREILAERAKAAEKARDKTLADKTKAPAEIAKPAEKERPAGKAFDAAGQKKTLEALAQGFGTGALPLGLYESKVRTLGLTADEIREIESAAAQPKIKAYVEVKDAFRAGKIDWDEYKEKIRSL